MLKTYVTAMPLQPRSKDGQSSGLKRVRYAPETAEPKQDTIATSFPIRQVMHNTLRGGDKAKVIAIVLDNADTAASLETFRMELTQEGIALTDENFVTLTIPENQSTDNLLHLCQMLVDALPETTQVHACLTFGTKPIPLAALCALNCAEKIKRELEIGGTYYGELKREGGRFAQTEDGVGVGTLYNATAFYRLGNIISQVDDPDSAKALFGHLLDMQMPEEG